MAAGGIVPTAEFAAAAGDVLHDSIRRAEEFWDRAPPGGGVVE